MKFQALALFASLLTVVQAHTRVFGIAVNGVDQGDGRSEYIRSPPSNSPLKDVRVPEMACNVANVAAPSSVKVKGGDTVTIEWYHDNRNDDIIDNSHKGPVIVYIAPASSNGAGKVWTKLFEDGHNGQSWAVDRLIEARGKHSVIIPNIAAGKYLLRSEIIALHEGEVSFTANAARGAQFYPSCIQIEVTSNGNLALPNDVSIPGAYAFSDAGVTFNIYTSVENQARYVVPGPPVWSQSPGGAIGTVVRPGTGSQPTTTSRVVATTSSSVRPTTSTTASPVPTSGGNAVGFWGQCGGINYRGSTTCVAGSRCVRQNDWYFQCLP